MRMPSVKTLCAEFRNLERSDALLLRRIGKAAHSEERLRAVIEAKCPATADYVRGMYGNPYDSHMWRVTVALHAMDKILGTCGVEGLGGGNAFNAPPYEYLNAGDPYVATLIYTRATDTIRVGSWGDIAERLPRPDDQY